MFSLLCVVVEVWGFQLDYLSGIMVSLDDFWQNFPPEDHEILPLVVWIKVFLTFRQCVLIFLCFNLLIHISNKILLILAIIHLEYSLTLTEC